MSCAISASVRRTDSRASWLHPHARSLPVLLPLSFLKKLNFMVLISLVVFEFVAAFARAQTAFVGGVAEKQTEFVAAAFASVVAALFIHELFFFQYGIEF